MRASPPASRQIVSLRSSERRSALLSQGLAASAEDLGEPAPDRESRVAVGDQGGDEDLAVCLAELQDLQSAGGQPAMFIWLVVRKGGLSVAGAGPQLHAVWAGGGEYGGFDERRGGDAALEPRGQRWH